MASGILYIKNSVFVIGLLSTMLSSQAQNTIEDSEYQWAPDTIVYETANGELGRIIYSYNEQEKKYSKSFQIWLDSSWINRLVDTYSYNDSNRSLTESTMTWNEKWQKWEQRIKVYDSQNKLTERIDQSVSGEEWENIQRELILYDSIKNKDVRLSQKWNKKTKRWKSKDRKISQYNVNHMIIHETYQVRKKNRWANKAQYFYEYDHNKNLSREVRYSKHITQYIYTYDEKNHKLSQQSQIWENKTWKNRYQTIYSYNENGLNQSIMEQEWGNNAWINTRQILYYYNQNNNPIKTLYQFWGNNNWENSGQLLSTYDNKGNLITDISQRWRNNEWQSYIKVTQDFDDNNNMLVEEYWRINLMTNDSTANGFKFIYNYDEYGNCTQGTSWIWENNKWKKTDQLAFLPSKNEEIKLHLLAYQDHKMTVSYIKIPKCILFLFKK